MAPTPAMPIPPPPSTPPTTRFRRISPRQLPDVFAAFQTLEDGTSVALTHPSTPDPSSSSQEEPPTTPGPWLGVRSSGTTGLPRLAWHPWPQLRASAVPSPKFHRWSWASPFRPESFAGVQVALQAWHCQGRCLPLDNDWTNVWADLDRTQPEALCCTPTFLELLLATEPPPSPTTGRWSPRQITLGGEPLRPGLGHRLRLRFADADFTAIYASAELGLIAKSHRTDGWYETDSFAPRWNDWRVVDGELHLRRHDTWTATGDRIELDPARRSFRILGRTSAVANVAGVKIPLAEVETRAEEVPGIRAAHAWAEPNPVVGQVVALRYGLLPNAQPTEVRAALEHHLRRSLRKEAWPRRWELGLPELGTNAKRTS
jgi:acyl-coenzyme A synthetase/AMP-(fatty) acid ligase